MIPTWLRARGETFRTVRLRTCHRCHAPVLSGLDADICAFAVHADPTPVNEIGEAIALLTGRRTFDLIGIGPDKRLYAREEHNIKEPRKYLVFPEHRCGQSLAAHSEPTSHPQKSPIPEVPPF